MAKPQSLAQIGELVHWFNAFLDNMEKRAEADTRLRIATTAFGPRMGLHVIAEGVETEGQHEFLRVHGCNAFQGYLFSRPLPLDQFENFLSSQNGL